MSDPFEQLRLPGDARTPGRDFRRALRLRLVEALAADPSTDPTPTTTDEPTPNRRRPAKTDTTTPTTTTPTTTTPTAVAATALQAYLAVSDGAAAIDFYRRAFGAVEQFRVVGDDGRLGHAEVSIGQVRLMLSDEYPEMGVRSPTTLGGSGVMLHLEVPDCDGAHDAAVRAGATSLRPPEDQAHGSRTATVTDPFGHRWMLSQLLEVFDLDVYAQREAAEFEVRPAAGSTTADDRRTAPATVWPCLTCADARATIDLLVRTFGFEERLVVADDADPSVIHHAELRWPEGGGVMLGSAGKPGGESFDTPTGAASVYVVSDRVGELWQRSLDAGLQVVSGLEDKDYGGQGFGVRDAEGNIWSFGTYAGE